VDGLASPLHWPMAHKPPTEGTRLACKATSGLVAVVVSRVCQGKGSFPGHCYWLEVLSSSVPTHGISHSKMGSYKVVLTPLQGHDVISVCSPGIATLGGNGMDSVLECSMPGVHGFQLLRSIVVGAEDRRYPRPMMSNTYPHHRAPEHPETWVPFSGIWVR
jgi:hypothetical protein